jgi:hypothetical protein
VVLQITSLVVGYTADLQCHAVRLMCALVALGARRCNRVYGRRSAQEEHSRLKEYGVRICDATMVDGRDCNKQTLIDSLLSQGLDDLCSRMSRPAIPKQRDRALGFLAVTAFLGRKDQISNSRR